MDAVHIKFHINPEILDHQEIDPVVHFCSHLATTLNAIGSSIRQLHPPNLPKLSRALEPFERRFLSARKNFFSKPYPKEFHDLIVCLRAAADDTRAALDGIANAHEKQDFLPILLKALHSHSRAQERLYGLHFIPPVSRYFLEKDARPHSDEYCRIENRKNDAGLFCLTEDGENYGYLYIPETIHQPEAMPMVIALHGGAGTGREFIWFWLREARTRRFILLAPSAGDRTWSFDSNLDFDRILSSIEFIGKSYPIQKGKTLLTGFSDGAIYTLTCGLMEDSPFTDLAPVSGILHPFNLQNANGRRVYLVHGVLDWMFPVSYAENTYRLMQTYGADITFDKIDDLSHTYPREANDRILKWFDPSLTVDNVRLG